jgi:hypothetical protein
LSARITWIGSSGRALLNDKGNVVDASVLVGLLTFMEKALEKERKKRMLSSIPETARIILGEHLAKNES